MRGVLKATPHTITPQKTVYFCQRQRQLPDGKWHIEIEYARHASSMITTGSFASQTPQTAPYVEPHIILIWGADPRNTSQLTKENDNQAQDAKMASWQMFAGCQHTVGRARSKSNSITQGKKLKAWPFWTTNHLLPSFTHQLPPN